MKSVLDTGSTILNMSYVFLSHTLDEGTPLYGGEHGIVVKQDKAIDFGDSCNTSVLTMPSHAGTHVDAPFHFIQKGKSIDQFKPEDWIFRCPLIMDISVDSGQLITQTDLPQLFSDSNVDLVIFRSGFERFRKQETYWQEGPGIGPELAKILIEYYPNMRAVGMDFISISSLRHRNVGRLAHKAFLERGILLFEDMRLAELKDGERLQQVIALPLRFAEADAAPCTILGIVE